MKKLFILAVLALTVAGTAAAATKSSSKKSASAKENGLFMGGSMGFTFTNISSNGDGQSGVSFKLVADGGYNFNKTFGIGAQLGYAHGVAALGGFDITDVKALASTMVGGMVDAGSKNLSINGFTMAPYARITLFGGKTVRFFIEPTFSFSLASIVRLEETGLADMIGDDDDDDDGDGDGGKGGGGIGGIGGMMPDNSVLIGLGLLARPGVAINLDDHFQLFAKLGSVGFQIGVFSSPDAPDNTTTMTRFGFDVATANLLMGLTYRF